MAQLGVHVTARTSPPSGGVPTATDTWLVAGATDVGDTGVATEVRDIAQFETEYGSRTGGNTVLWDALDVFFREGGNRALISRGPATGTDISAPLAAFGKNLGPGQVSAIGYTDDPAATVGLQVYNHCRDNNRFGLVDAPDSSTIADVETYGAALAAGDAATGLGMACGPWAIVPAPAGIAGGATRTVNPSAVIAGLCARVDQTGNPNQAAAGRSYPLDYVQDFTQHYSLDDIEQLLDGGVNSMAEIYGVLENYGFQTSVTETTGNPFWQANCARMRMAIVAGSQEIGEQFMFKPIDGKGLLANSLKNALSGMLLGFYDLNGLYGDVPSEAFDVNVGASVNTISNIAQGVLKAVASVVLTLHAKSVEIELVTVPVGGSVR